MSKIQIIDKPDWISWDSIHEVLLEAHKKNIEKGIVMRYPQMKGSEIEKTLGEEGRCWVALDGDKLIGTDSVTFFTGKDWWNKNQKVAHVCFTGILQKYQGLGILEDLNECVEAYIKDRNVSMSQGTTAENNYNMREWLANNSYKTVGYFCSKSHHYSVIVVKWFDKCSFSDNFINFRCKISEILVKIQYKPGKIERFWLLSLFCKCINKLLKLISY